MNLEQVKYELQYIISGKSSSSNDALIQTVTHNLRGSKRSGPMAEEKHQNKAKETEKLKQFALNHKLIYDKVNVDHFVSKGAEQSVYINDYQSVIKLNDSIYYASWEDYFFSDTAYEFLGLYIKDDKLFSVVEQPYVKADEITDLNKVREFLSNNGFKNTKNHDYYHPELGIILEDLHDENVLTKNGMLYFIDTVFFINPDVFWK